MKIKVKKIQSTSEFRANDRRNKKAYTSLQKIKVKENTPQLITSLTFLLLLNKKERKKTKTKKKQQPIKHFFPKGVEAEIVNTKPREKRKSVPYIEMGDLLYAVLKIAVTRMGQ